MREVKRSIASPRAQRKEISQNGGERPKSPNPKAAWNNEEKQGATAPVQPQVN